MTSHEFDIVIVGGGCVGSSIFHELSRSGFGHVGLIDSGRTSTSATAHSGGMIRVFHESSAHVELALGHIKSRAKYKKMGILSETDRANGSLYFFNKRRYRDYQKNLQIMETANYPFEVLTAQCGQKRFPDFQWTDDEWAIFEKQGSCDSPLRFSEDLLSAGQKNGLSILDSFEVTRICKFRDQYRIIGDRGSVMAKVVVLAGGARILPLLRDLGLCLSLEAKTLTTYTGAKSNADYSAPNYFDRETLEFGRLGAGTNLAVSNPTDSRLRNKPWRDHLVKQSANDCYAPDRQGVVGQIPGHPKLILATGWGGTAFKFALEVGRRATLLVEKELQDRRMIYA